MTTLNAQADRIANLLKEPDNHELKERIKVSFKAAVAMLIRQSFEKHGIDESVLLPFDVELIDVKYPDTMFNSDLGIRMKKSKYKIPTPVRFVNSAPYVSVEDGATAFTFIHPRELKNHVSFLSIGGSVAYFVEKSHIYCCHFDPTMLLKSKYIRVVAPFENPEEVLGFYDMTSDWQDIILPIPIDMINNITTMLLRNEFGVIPNPSEIKVELDERPDRTV